MSEYNRAILATEPPGRSPVGAVPSWNGQDAEEQDARSYRDINGLLTKTSALVQQTSDPGAASAYALDSLRARLAYDFELLYGRFRAPALDGGDAERRALLQTLWDGADPA